MDVKGPNSKVPIWPGLTGPEQTASAPPATAFPNAALEAAPAGPMGEVQARYSRADLYSEKWPAILQSSAEALVKSAASSFPSLSEADQKKIAAFIAADPLMSRNILSYWEQHLK